MCFLSNYISVLFISTHYNQQPHQCHRDFSHTGLLLHAAFAEQLELWANAQRDGRPAEYMWRPLFNAAKFG